MDELEDDLQLTEDAKLRLEVNLQAAKSQYERDSQAREEAAEEKRKGLQRQLREMEQELDEGKILILKKQIKSKYSLITWALKIFSERKARAAALASKKKLEIEVTDLSSHSEAAARQKDDLVRQLQRLQRMCKDLRLENDEVKQEKENATAAQR